MHVSFGYWMKIGYVTHLTLMHIYLYITHPRKKIRKLVRKINISSHWIHSFVLPLGWLISIGLSIGFGRCNAIDMLQNEIWSFPVYHFGSVENSPILFGFFEPMEKTHYLYIKAEKICLRTIYTDYLMFHTMSKKL